MIPRSRFYVWIIVLGVAAYTYFFFVASPDYSSTILRSPVGSQTVSDKSAILIAPKEGQMAAGREASVRVESIRRAQDERARSQISEARRFLCAHYFNWPRAVAKAPGQVKYSQPQRMVEITARDCGSFREQELAAKGWRRGTRVWIDDDEVVALTATIDAGYIASDFTRLLDDIDIASESLTFLGVKYEGEKFGAALLALRLLPCEFGWHCGRDNFEVEAACSGSGRCFSSLQELLFSNAKRLSIDSAEVAGMASRFAAALREREESASTFWVSPFASDRPVR
jgi:hypothetical protein